MDNHCLFKYNVESVAAKEKMRSRAPATVLPRYNEGYSHNTESLQPFTRAYVDSENDELVVERGANFEPLRMYELAQIRCLAAEDIITLASMNIHYKPKFEDSTRDYMNHIRKLANIVRGIPNEED
ncbi:hypothetical protein L1987_48345 [Smallanthus sonchifolius]|uniref:Uncharacterized protein n=1 Tax=Smallanthus sonchifolius TaxID=185202 RepID=A0ACB9FSL7_9ASTR|nr:hypothetical protein L1987_48345 [Smallanthus sonchifolius]